jgi:NAD-dependent dihydropyrimidine dehydrogenase PreA subunit
MKTFIGRRWLGILLCALPVLGGGVGYGAGPFLARRHAGVQLLWQLHHEQSAGAAPTVESDAFRAAGRTMPELRAEAEGIVDRFRVGGACLGLWCGVVVSLRLRAAGRSRRRTAYEMDASTCVSCARCFMNCPQERARRGLIETPQAAGRTHDAPT